MNYESMNDKSMNYVERMLRDYARNSIRLHLSAMGRTASRGMMYKATQGFFPGRAPLGYKNAWVGTEKGIVVDHKTASKVKGLFAAAGKETTLAELAAEARKLGLRSRNGKPLRPSAVRVILSNPFYAGKFRYQGALFTGRHKALIEERHFDAVQTNLTRGKRLVGE